MTLTRKLESSPCSIASYNNLTESSLFQMTLTRKLKSSPCSIAWQSNFKKKVHSSVPPTPTYPLHHYSNLFPQEPYNYIHPQIIKPPPKTRSPQNLYIHVIFKTIFIIYFASLDSKIVLSRVQTPSHVCNCLENPSPQVIKNNKKCNFQDILLSFISYPVIFDLML